MKCLFIAASIEVIGCLAFLFGIVNSDSSLVGLSITAFLVVIAAVMMYLVCRGKK